MTISQLTVTLSELADQSVLSPSTIRLARHLAFLYSEQRDLVVMAAACTISALSAGSVCFDLRTPQALQPEDDEAEPLISIDWPAPDEWVQALRSSPMVSLDPAARDRPLVLDGESLYLTRYWAEQERIIAWVRDRLAGVDARDGSGVREATDMVAGSRFAVVAGGPGTGKTTAMAHILVGLAQGRTDPLRVILTAPTGRAAARLEQSVQRNLADMGDQPLSLTSGTLHRVLGLKPWGGQDHDASHPLAADVVVVDEASMLSLHLMALLLDAVAEPTRLILVGDPDQLASVEAGAVLADIVASNAVPVARMTHTYRFSGDLARLAEAIRVGDPDQALAILAEPSEQIEWIQADPGAPGFDPDTLAPLRTAITDQGLSLIDAASTGDAQGGLDHLQSHRLLLAHRHGRSGVSYWTYTARSWLARLPGGPPMSATWFPGLPVLITRNDDLTRVFNGDSGVIVDAGTDLALALDDPAGPRLIAPDMVPAWEPLYASTIHKAQGSQYDAVSLIVPPPTTALLTRELLYTAVTRAQSYLRVVGTADAIRAAIESPALRASGLAEKLNKPQQQSTT